MRLPRRQTGDLYFYKNLTILFPKARNTPLYRELDKYLDQPARQIDTTSQQADFITAAEVYLLLMLEIRGEYKSHPTKGNKDLCQTMKKAHKIAKTTKLYTEGCFSSLLTAKSVY